MPSMCNNVLNSVIYSLLKLRLSLPMLLWLHLDKCVLILTNVFCLTYVDVYYDVASPLTSIRLEYYRCSIFSYHLFNF